MLLATVASAETSARIQLGTDERPLNELTDQLVWGFDAFYGAHYHYSGVVTANDLNSALNLIITELESCAPGVRAVKMFRNLAQAERILNYVGLGE